MPHTARTPSRSSSQGDGDGTAVPRGDRRDARKGRNRQDRPDQNHDQHHQAAQDRPDRRGEQNRHDSQDRPDRRGEQNRRDSRDRHDSQDRPDRRGEQDRHDSQDRHDQHHGRNRRDRRGRRDPRDRRNQRRAYRRTRQAAGEVARYLRTEQVGGLILLATTVLALVLANSPLREKYGQLRDLVVGPAALHLDLSLHQWATDGLLTLFFVVVGLELKRELVTGELRNPRTAMLPLFSAIGGMVVPALVFLAVAAGATGTAEGWAVPVATDIAFALAVLAVVARQLPASLRMFLLTLAIVDDLGAILLIAALFTGHIAGWPLLGALATIAGYALLQRARVAGWWLYVPLAMLAWALLHASGVHATLAGVMIGFATRVVRDPGEKESPGHAAEHRLQPISAGVAVPCFAFFAAGVSVSGGALSDLLSDRVALAVVAGLVVGKAAGVLGAAALAVRLRLAVLPGGLGWRDMAAVSVLTGCGFTVSLLIAELAFDTAGQGDRVKLAVLAGSLAATMLSALLLRRRARAHA